MKQPKISLVVKHEESIVQPETGGSMNLGFNDTEVSQLNTVEVPERYYQRLVTGEPTVDVLFGGIETPGFASFASILLTGEPGAGKSTFVMGLADSLQKRAGKNVLYNVGEQNKFVVKMTADRMGLDAQFSVSQFAEVGELVRYARETKVQVLIQDSIQTLTSQGKTGKALITSVGETLCKTADNENILVIMIGHITKAGSMAGPMVLKHMVDAHAHMSVDKEGTRAFELEKNRFGPSHQRIAYTLSRAGLKFISDDEAIDVDCEEVDEDIIQEELDEIDAYMKRGPVKRFWDRIRGK